MLITFPEPEPLSRPGLGSSHLSLSSQVTGFRSYVELYVKDKLDEVGVALKVVHESVNERWEVCLTMSEKGFQQISFVNSIATTKVTSPQGIMLLFYQKSTL